MSIQNGDIPISANFQLNVSKPLDSRTIVTNFTDLANITFKYSGMLVYVTELDAHFTLDSTNTWILFSGQSGSLVADNGITISNDIIELGGDLVKTTSINTDNFNFSIINGTNGLINISDKILIGNWTTSLTPISGDSSYKIANTEFVTNAISQLSSYTVSNGLTMLNNNIKLGGALTEPLTHITGTLNNSLQIGNYGLNENLNYIGFFTQSLFATMKTTNLDMGYNTININPGGFYQSNTLLSNISSSISSTPQSAMMRFSDSKIIEIVIYGGIASGSGESFTIEGVTFTEGIDFVGQGDSVLDVNYLLSNIPWNTIPNFEIAEGDFEYSPTIILKFYQNVTSSHTFSNGFINKNLHSKEITLQENNILLKSNKNEITLTDSTTLIQSDNVHIVQLYPSGKSYTGFFNESSIELTHYDVNDKKSQLTLGLSDRSSLSRFNNKIVGLAVTGNILPSESFTLNGITFTEGIDFTVVDDPIIDAETISNIDYSSVPNLYEVKYIPLTQVIKYLFYYPATLTNNMVNCYPINNVYVNEVSVSDGFAMLRSNDSSIMLTETNHTFRDDNSIKSGLQYFDDYSANFTTRSLVDKGYVDSIGGGGTPSTGYIHVDVTNGNDATAEKYSDTKRFSTVAAALAVSVSGDIIHLYPGLYDESLLVPISGTTLLMDVGATIAPSGNNGNLPIFSEELMPGGWGGASIQFKIRGRGRLINRGWAGPDTCAIEVSRNGSNWDIEAEEVSTFSTNRPTTNNIIFTNVKFTYEVDTYGSNSTKSLLYENCKFINCNMTNRNFGWGVMNTQYIRCKFIRTVATIQKDIDFPSGKLSGLTTFKYERFPNGFYGNQPEKVQFYDCIFYNNVGGDNFYLQTLGNNANAVLFMHNCRFYTNDLAKASLVFDGTDGGPSPIFLLEGNISNTSTSNINGAVLTNSLSGTGFQVHPSFVMAREF
jgi:hypothetical protein